MARGLFFQMAPVQAAFLIINKIVCSVFIAAEHTAMADVFETVLIDQDRDEIRFDLERGDKGVRELFYDPAFLFRGPAFAHLEYNDGHNIT
jgi:hypothetical protein